MGERRNPPSTQAVYVMHANNPVGQQLTGDGHIDVACRRDVCGIVPRCDGVVSHRTRHWNSASPLNFPRAQWDADLKSFTVESSAFIQMILKTVGEL